jgi:hypothetical protein
MIRKRLVKSVSRTRRQYSPLKYCRAIENFWNSLHFQKHCVPTNRMASLATARGCNRASQLRPDSGWLIGHSEVI